jgi:hypothetical protein
MKNLEQNIQLMNNNFLLFTNKKYLYNTIDTEEDKILKDFLISKMQPTSERELYKCCVNINHIVNRIKYGAVTNKSDVLIKKYIDIIPTSYFNNNKYIHP